MRSHPQRSGDPLPHLTRFRILSDLRRCLLAAQLNAMVRSELANIMCGSVFLFVGVAACAFAAIRRRGQVRLFFWIGLWSGFYGTRLLLESPAFVAVLPRSVQAHVSTIWMTVIYFLLPVGTLAWLELAIGKVRLFLQAVIAVSLIIAAAGSVRYAMTGSNDPLLFYNHVVSIVALFVLVVVVAVPRLLRKYLVLPNRAVVVTGTLAFALRLFISTSRPPCTIASCRSLALLGSRFFCFHSAMLPCKLPSPASAACSRLKMSW